MHKCCAGLLAFILSGCETLPVGARESFEPTPETVFSSVPEPGFHLSAEERAKLPAGVAVEALEAVLARVRPEHRPEVLRVLAEIGSQGQAVSFGPMAAEAVDPKLRAILQRVRTTSAPQVPPKHQ
jgi:hypothetical protein